MPKLPNLNSKQLIKILERKGYTFNHATGSHYFYKNLTNKKIAVVPFHNKDIGKGLLNSILKDADISREEVISLK
jgi:predicted RNA binding protein YcfA (HicA-like mRNA interferase family)